MRGMVIVDTKCLEITMILDREGSFLGRQERRKEDKKRFYHFIQ